MKQISIGDIHGRTVWKDIVAKHPEADRFLFIGDYVDTHESITGLEQVNNLREIIEFKKNNPSKVTLLIGNHDFQYWPGITEQYSGYQPNMHASFEYEFNEYKKLFQMCFEDEHGTIYSHAGLTETFVEQRIGSYSEKNVNDVWKYKPQSFGFFYGDTSGCGDDIHQGCLWVRPQSLHRDKIDNFQVVGHTQVSKINHPPKSEIKGFYDIDCLAQGMYLSCTDGKFQIEKL